MGEFKSADECRTVRARQRNLPDVYQAVLLRPCGAASLIGGEPDARRSKLRPPSILRKLRYLVVKTMW